MKTLKILISLIVISTFATSSSNSDEGFGLGAAVGYYKVSADGTETEGTAADTSDRTESVSNNVFLPALFAEFEASNGFRLGFEYTPVAADVSDKVKQRSETAVGVSGESTDGAITRKAQAEVDGHYVVYAELPVYNNWYIRAGYTELDVTTTENSQTDGGNYGNKSGLSGYNVGLGTTGSAGANGYYKLAFEYTDFDTLSLSSTSNNSISADLDTMALRYSLGYKF